MNKPTISIRPSPDQAWEEVPYDDLDRIAAARYINGRGCTALTSLDAPVAEKVCVADCAALISLHAPVAEYVDASGCTSLTSLDAPIAERVYVGGCTALTELRAPEARTVYALGCAALTRLHAPAAERIVLLPNNHEDLHDLKPWREEMADARRIFEDVNPRIGDRCMWLHHEITFERLTAPWQERFDYIATKKPEEERAWRFRLLRPTSPEAMKQFGITTK